jgi:exodeoxyribonuclease VII small subunit
MPDERERLDLKSFEASFEELEALVRKLESGALTLDESLGHYEQGVAALRRCYRILEHAEKRLELLVREGDGLLATRPVDLRELRGEARGEARIGPAAAPPAPRREEVDVRTGEVIVVERSAPGPAPAQATMPPLPPAVEAAARPSAAPAPAQAQAKKKDSSERSLF